VVPRPAILLGALTTIAVAWCLALAPTRRQWSLSGMPLDPPPLSASTRDLNIEHERGPGDEWAQLVIVMMQDGVLPDGTKCIERAGTYASLGPILRTDPSWRIDRETAPDIYGAIESFPHPRWPYWLPPIPARPRGLLSYGARATGWPLKSMRSVSRLDSIGGELRWSGSLRVRPRTAYRIQAARGPQLGCIPLFPVPLAFAEDTLLFAGIWSLPLLLPGLIRAGNRRRHGRCPTCGYEWRGRPLCPECGAAHDPFRTVARDR
jgi:hypothetical protein